MPQERSDMRRVKEVLRLAHELGYSNRQIQESVRMGRTSVGEYLARAREAGVRYADVAGMGEAEVEALLFKRRYRISLNSLGFTWLERQAYSGNFVCFCSNPTAKPPALLERLTAVQHWRE